MAEGEFALVREYLEQGLQKVSWPTEWGSMGSDLDVYTMLADVAAGHGDEAAIRHYAGLAEEMATHCGHRLYQGIAHRAWGVAHRLANEPGEAESRFNQALELFGKLDTRWQIGRTLAELGDLARTRQALDEARDYFARALAMFEEMKATPDAARTRVALESMNL